MFLILGSLATVSLVLWVWNHGALEKSCKALSAEKAAKRKTARFKQTGAPKAAGAG
jgi:hypothetical protein